jgi:hypothetical protein
VLIYRPIMSGNASLRMPVLAFGSLDACAVGALAGATASKPR